MALPLLRKRARAEDEEEEGQEEGAAAKARVTSTDDEKTCRICFAGAEDGALVQPCACQGSSSRVHGGYGLGTRVCLFVCLFVRSFIYLVHGLRKL